MATAFEALEQTIRSLGSSGEGGITLNDLTILEEEDGKAIAFDLIGSEFYLAEDGTISTVAENEEGEIQAYALADELRDQLIQYLKWRVNFARKFFI